jgi:adhesin HecA-like repeat protein
MIDISAPVVANIHIRNHVQPTVRLVGYHNLLNEIESALEGSTLRISHRNFISFNTDKDVIAEITVAALSDLHINGSGDAAIDGPLVGTDFKMKISGAGDVTIEELNVINLTSIISGAGNVHIKSGSADNVYFKISGAGSINSYGLQANSVSAKVSGAGDMSVTALQTLEAKVSGAGSIRYKGRPSLKSETSGVGEIAAAD